MEREFLEVAKDGKVEVVKDILRKNPKLDVNFDDYGWTFLHYACRNGHDAIVSILLVHPDIDVNLKSRYGHTPFLLACANGRISCVREMLKDSRVKVNEPSSVGHTPLVGAAFGGHLDVIKWWIASGREVNLGKPGDVDKTDAIGMAKQRGKTEIATLLERFKSDASKTRHAVRVELGWYDQQAAEMFALVVFVSDGLLQTNDSTTTTPAARFFNIARRLPLELQMMLCFRQVGSTKEIIAGKESEVAFKELARRLW